MTLIIQVMLLPVPSRGHFDSESIWLFTCVQGGALMKHDNFGADGTKNAEVTSTSCLMAPH